MCPTLKQCEVITVLLYYRQQWTLAVSRLKLFRLIAISSYFLREPAQVRRRMKTHKYNWLKYYIQELSRPLRLNRS